MQSSLTNLYLKQNHVIFQIHLSLKVPPLDVSMSEKGCLSVLTMVSSIYKLLAIYSNFYQHKIQRVILYFYYSFRNCLWKINETFLQTFTSYRLAVCTYLTQASFKEHQPPTPPKKPRPPTNIPPRFIVPKINFISQLFPSYLCLGYSNLNPFFYYYFWEVLQSTGSLFVYSFIFLLASFLIFTPYQFKTL